MKDTLSGECCVTSQLVDELERYRLERRTDSEPSFSEIIHALADLVDGQFVWHEIRAHTGLSDDRCREIERIASWALLKSSKLRKMDNNTQKHVAAVKNTGSEKKTD